MLKSLLVHIPSERAIRPVVDGAISLAVARAAHLDAISVGYETANVGLAVDGGAAVAAIFEVERERALVRANDALAVFEAEARNAGISYSLKALTGLPGEGAATVGASARLYDLTIVLQPDSDFDTFDNTMPQEILFQSGGPVLFIPKTHKGPVRAETHRDRVGRKPLGGARPPGRRTVPGPRRRRHDHQHQRGAGSVERHCGHLGDASRAAWPYGTDRARERRPRGYPANDAFHRGRHGARSDRHGRLRPFAPSGAHSRRSYAGHAAIHDRAGADVALSFAPWRERASRYSFRSCFFANRIANESGAMKRRERSGGLRF